MGFNDEERKHNRAAIVRYKLIKIEKNHEAKYSREHRMLYIPCEIQSPGGNEDHPAQPKSAKNASKSKNITYVPLASMLHQRVTRIKLIKELFHAKSQKKLATSILGNFDLLKREILSQIVPSAAVVAQDDEIRPRVVLDRLQVKDSPFSHARTPSWQKWDTHFTTTLVPGNSAEQLLDFAEHDVLSHGAAGAVLKYGYKSAKHTALFEWMQEFHTTAEKSSAQTEH